jgi:deazaflavin-dependent oxidoreductase (nitroreductase family)
MVNDLLASQLSLMKCPMEAHQMPVQADELTWNERIIANFRENGGVMTMAPFVGAHLLLLTSIGARSGKPSTAPLGYTRDGERYVVVGSNSGKAENPAWLYNIRADERVTVEVGREQFPATARITTGAERTRLWEAHKKAIPPFAEYERMAGRELPVIVLERIER